MISIFKQLFSICLLLAFLARPAFQFGIVLDYSVNVNSIIENFCVNKDKPKLQCNGKCYLTKKLAQADDSISTKNKTITIEESFIPVFFCSSAFDIKISWDKPEVTQNFRPVYTEKLRGHYIKNIDPPENIAYVRNFKLQTFA